MSLSAGEKLGPYEILAPIGAGGMGQVYRARDPRLGRDVAIKVSGAQFTERFEREARAVAALNHPNICTLFDVGPNYLVMELVEGPTLADRTAAGKIPLAETLAIARQIVDALEAAHEKNIVHRDLKPANIKVKPDGTVKVLDFGLAKTAEGSASGSNPENSPTLTLQDATRAGVILGTAGYMSPEQASGKPVDKRADIWAFGVVLWEMLTGRKMFAGETVSHTIAAVLVKDPDWQQLPADTPPSLKRLLKRCIERDLKRRLGDIGTARLEIEEAAELRPELGTELTAPSESRLGKAGWIAAAALALALAALAFAYFREKPPAADVTRFQFPLPAGQSNPAPFPVMELSPDGRKFAFAARGADGKMHVWIRSLDSLEARSLSGVEVVLNPLVFFWSPDSRFLAFASEDRKLKKVDIAGGPAQTLCDCESVVGGSWSRDGVILFADGIRGVMRVPEAGGTPTPVTTVDPARKEQAHGFPQFLPDGRHFLYFRLSTTPENKGIYVGAIDVKPSQQSTRLLLRNDYIPEYYVPDGSSNGGYLLSFREGTVVAQRFDASKLALNGDPVPIADQVGSFQSVLGFFSASAGGVLGYVGGNVSGNYQLTWFDRDGKNLGAVGEPGSYDFISISPDGKQAVVSRSEGGKSNLWLLDFTRNGAASRFTFDASFDGYPVWSPDGSRIVFASNRNGRFDLYQKLTSGAKEETLLLKSDESKYPYDWSADGRFLTYSVQTAKTKDDIWILPMDGSQKPMLFQGTEFNETGARFSPDGKWISYSSDESGRSEVYVREFTMGSDGKPEPSAHYQISTGGALAAGWRDDGKEILYLSPDYKSMSAEVSTRPKFQVSPPKMMFQNPAGAINGTITRDGKRLLLAVPTGQSGPMQFTIVENWQAGLKK